MAARRLGKYRSGLEAVIGRVVERLGFKYEPTKLAYHIPARKATYLPDWVREDVIIEAKGRFTSQDRKKMLLLKEQHPDKVFIMIFGQAHNRLSKKSSTTYADWCDKNGLVWVDYADFERNPKECLSNIMKKHNRGSLAKTSRKPKKTHLSGSQETSSSKP